MRIRILSLFAGLAIGGCLGLSAQTASWLIQPQYSTIQPYSEQLFKVKNGYSTGLVDKSGKEVVPISADSITDMRNGHALTLKYTSDGRFKLMGVLHHDLTYSTVHEDYYVSNYPFYSEDKLPVYNEKGRLGYIDPNGREAIEFNLVEAHPFSGGIAAISKGKGGVIGALGNAASGLLKAEKKGTPGYIKGDGKFVTIQKNIGKLQQAYSFRNGEALVVTEKGRYCFINERGQLVREDNNILISVDEMYAYNPNARNQKEKMEYKPVYNGPSTFSDGNKIGYRQGSKVILPPQFSHAQPFSDNYAIAAINGKYGVLQLKAHSFKHNPKFSKMDNGSDQMLDYELTVPTEWKDKTLTMYCKLNDGTESKSVSQPSGSDTRIFSFSLPTGEKPTFRLEGENLVIWEESMKQQSSAANSDLEIKIASTKVKAKPDTDAATVVIRIVNNASYRQEVTASVSGPKVNKTQKKLVIEAGESQRVYAVYPKVMKEGTYKLTIKLSNGTAVEKNITVEPFFNNL